MEHVHGARATHVLDLQRSLARFRETWSYLTGSANEKKLFL